MSLRVRFGGSEVARAARGAVIACALLSVSAAAQEFKPVRDFEDLCGIADDLSGSYELVNDITVERAQIVGKFGADGFKPIGSEKAPFTGKFRGKDKKTFVIRGLYVDRPKEGDVGLFGYVGSGAEISCIGVVTDAGGVTGSYSVGTLVGTNKGAIENCYGAGFVSARRSESSAGGLVGFNGGTIERSYSAAVVDGKEYVGGLAGFLTVAASGQISQSYATGEVSGTNYVGGLIGYIFDGGVEKCFSTGKVVGVGETSIVGGLVGGNFGVSNTSWNVRGKNGAGGYVKAAEIKNSFWDKNTSGQNTSVGGEGKTSEEMADSATFAGWDFDTTWNIKDGANYPQLQEAPICTLTYRAGINGKLRVNGVILPQDSVFAAVLEEGSRTPEVTAVPDEHYTFANWSDKAADSVRADVASESAPVNVTALFLLKPNASTCKLTYMVAEGHDALGALRVNATGVVMESSKYSMTVVRGTAGFEITAVPAKGCKFLGWTDGVPDSVRADVASGDSVVIATFMKTDVDPKAPDAYYPLLYSSGAGGGLRMSRRADVLDYNIEPPLKEGERGPLMAAFPNGGCRFVRWNDGAQTLVRQDAAKPNAMFVAVFQEIAGDAIKIASFAELQKIGNDPAYPLDGSYILTEDIEIGNGFRPIGGRDKPFKGVFDGGAKKISGLTVNSQNGFVGLFGYAENARISRVYLTGVSVRGGSNTGALVGGCLNTAIDSCGVDGAVAGADSVGGLVGSAVSSLISRSYSMADVEGRNGAGGGVGGAARWLVTHCYAVGCVTGGEGVGGLLGRSEGGAAQYSYALGEATGGSAAGGFVGAGLGGAEFYQDYSAGYVVGQGGFAGAGADGGAAYMCYWDKERSERESSAGGLGIGQASDEMVWMSSYESWGWDVKNVWGIKVQGQDYPYLKEVEPEYASGMYKPRQTSARQTDKRLVKVRGRVMTISAPQGAALHVRLIDMRGRIVAKYDVQNVVRIPLNRVPSGRYMVETRDRGKRLDVSAIVLR
jgi:hypothetical protein